MTKEDKLNLLKLAHNSVEAVGDNLVIVHDFNEVSLVDYDGVTYCRYDNATDIKLKNYGSFLTIVSNAIPGESSLYNADTNRIVKFSGIIDRVSLLGDSNLAVLVASSKYKYRYRWRIYNKYMEEKAELPSAEKIIFYCDSGSNLQYLYKLNSWDRESHKIIINKLTGEIDSYDTIYLSEDDEIRAVATECVRCKKSGLNYGIGTLDSFRYKLKAYNKTSDKAYDGIVKFTHDSSCEFFKCIDNGKMGVLDKYTKEVINTIYSSIEKFGYNEYICYRFDGGIDIYCWDSSSNVMMTKLSLDVNRYNIHETLPILVYIKDNEYRIADIYGRDYKFTDIAKAFMCDVSNVNNSILRVNIVNSEANPLYKYVDTRLTPIYNMHLLSQIKLQGWTRI